MKRLLLSSAIPAVLLGLSMATAAHAEIKLGLGAPITGPNAAVGAQLKNGAEQAIADINAAGGILGEKVVLATGDDASDPKQGVSVANKFAGDGVKAVVGHYNSSVSIPASEVYEESGIIQISPGSTNPTLTDRNMWNVFRTCGRDDQQGAVAAEYIAKHYKDKKVAVIHDKTTYGKGLADVTKKVLNDKGIAEVIYEGINTGEKDFSALVSKIKQANVDIVYFGGLFTEAGLLVRQMGDQGLKTKLMSGDGIVSTEFAAIAGPGAAGTTMTFSADPRKNPAAKEAVAAFNAKNIDPEAYTLYSYASFQILKDAMTEAKTTTDMKKVAEVIHSGRVFKTVIGDLSYDKKGDITRPDYIVYEWKKAPDGRIDYTGNEVTE
ncbi:branched-chain amino acid ABC transporter substrate-binding protein [Microvirga sp. W0021]|uniref:Branched-chain amino acid ABC transporter substrate-binding protein n=1 Tax=Hohaiivirga grylli TaxID=3133970 RepID=A0ABV0BNT3_9HYPH